APGKTIPIERFSVRSFITNVTDDTRITVGKTQTLRGIAFDGGSGIKSVQLSTDGGSSWSDAKLGDEISKYSFREWTGQFTPRKQGEFKLMVRATNQNGETQPMQANWNPSGYRMNRIEQIRVIAA
ncbi:MAG TPA: oxidase, partial [Advenella sp.]|nr:oxidase [Advenella sp.]